MWLYIFNVKQTHPDYDMWKSISENLLIKEVILTLPSEFPCVNFSRASANSESCCVMAVAASMVFFHC